MKTFISFLLITNSFCQFTVEEDAEIFQPTASASSRVSERCSTHTDCIQGAYCESSFCRCLPSHIAIERYCWKKLGPEEAGCTYDDQCEAVWPGTTCQYSICKCPPNTLLAVTREGSVCHPPGQCPTNGLNGVLYNRNRNIPSQCHYFDGEIKGGSRFIGCDDYPELHDCIDGICCPSRALTCIQPLDTGISFTNQSITMFSRWFYNSITQSCQPFQYTGEGGNSNNFLTIQHCESYCKHRCARGQPQLLPSNKLDGQASEIVSCTSSTSGCDDSFECIHINGNNMCCPTAEFICSLDGAIVQETISIVAPSPVAPYSSGSYRHGTHPLTRWYWDSNLKQCLTFKYFGQGGNFNNFLSLEQCQEFCAPTVCSLGYPLKDGNGQSIACSTQTHCPRSHICTKGVCCPTQGTVCNQPISTGISCSSTPSKRFWFNAALGSCQEFEYQGCHGNTNNFLTFEICQKHCASVEPEPKCLIGKALQLESGRYWRCGQTAENGNCPADYECYFDDKNYGCCPTKDFICRQNIDVGTKCSSLSSIRWYYSSGQCSSFSYNGCDGNANNFASQKECLDFCHKSDCPDGGSGLVDDYGKLVFCQYNDNSCPSTHHCTQSQSSHQVNICCPTRQHICRENFDEGESCTKQPIRRYVFDPNQLVCRPFSFLGCGGNSNNFPSKMACFNFCQSAACAASEVIYQTTTSSEIFDCSTKSCPRGYSCVGDVWNPARRICCGSQNFGVCRIGQRSFIDYRTQQPMTCNPNLKTSCPIGFHCLLNQQKNNYYCCAEDISIATCPDGSKISRIQTTGDPQGCSSDDQCPRNSKCHRPDRYRSGVCCQYLDNVCPPTFIYDEELSEGQPECSPLDRETCDHRRQSVCLFSEKKNRFVCCRRENRKTVTVDKCPRGSQQDPLRIFCTQDKPCPSSHFCVRRDSDRVGICCSHPTLSREKPTSTTTASPSLAKYKCPNNLVAFVEGKTSDPQKCHALQPCPSPFVCTPTSFSSSVRICCASPKKLTSVCKEGTLPISIDGIQYSCKIKSCPPGYDCNDDVCCPTKHTACTEPPFMGTESTDAFSYFYDVESKGCQEFDYRGCNPSANTFIDHESCMTMCLTPTTPEPSSTTEASTKRMISKISTLAPIIIRNRNSTIRPLPIGVSDKAFFTCPSPFRNPEDWPQFCEIKRPSCAENEKCVLTGSGASICCVFKDDEEESKPTSSSLLNLMTKMCGDEHSPVLTRSGDPVRCSRQRPCRRGSLCLFSSVLMIDICCTKGRPSLFPMTPSIPIIPADPNFVVMNPMCDHENGCGQTDITTRKLYAGDTGCKNSEDCTGQAICVRGMCTCRLTQVQFHKICYWKCPTFYRNISGVCM
ncbi:unnamed protein product [Auanema sp. JU1783]|nr:unnamed protein product [Auanema sp. JU1783]